MCLLDVVMHRLLTTIAMPVSNDSWGNRLLVLIALLHYLLHQPTVEYVLKGGGIPSRFCGGRV